MIVRCENCPYKSFFFVEKTNINLQPSTMFTTKDIRQTRKVVNSGKSGLKTRGKVWKSWSAVQGIEWNSKSSKILRKLIVSENRFFQTDLSVLQLHAVTMILLLHNRGNTGNMRLLIISNTLLTFSQTYTQFGSLLRLFSISWVTTLTCVFFLM